MHHLYTVEYRYNAPNIVRYNIINYRNWGRISIRCWIHKRQPIARPNGRAMGCLFLDICEKSDRVLTEPHYTHRRTPLPLVYGWNWSLNKMADILQTTFSNAVSLMKISHLELTISWHCRPQVLAWCLAGNNPLPELIVTSFTDV